MKKYIVSGVPISDTGVGRLMKGMLPEAESRGYKLVTPCTTSLKEALKRLFLRQAILVLLQRLLGRSFLNLRLLLTRNSLVLFIHPQTAGFENLFRLARRNRVYLYVMDNSFFCVRSYNIDPYEHSECLRCLGKLDNSHPDCQPYPVDYKKKKNISYLNLLIEFSSKIVFLAQNKNQEILLRKHFGENIECLIVGLNTGEIPLNGIREQATRGHIGDQAFDVVYHGSTQLAKGITYLVRLAQTLKDFSFFVPENKERCESSIGYPIPYTNITFRECRWESGLKNVVSQARLVINPSLWSASIEGSLIKSVFYGAMVATVKTEYGFENELSKHVNLIRLPQNMEKASQIVRDILTDGHLADRRLLNRVRLVEFLQEKIGFRYS
jgi:hypothetical protein